MSLDAYSEQQAILARSASDVALAAGRAYDFIPEEQVLAKDALGIKVLPYLVLHFGGLIPLAGDRSIEGEEQQPHTMPVQWECWASSSSEARQMAGQVRTAFTGWAPNSDNASEIRLSGGTRFDNRDRSGRPSRWCEIVTGELDLNNSITVP